MTPAEIAGLAERCERATPADLSDLGLALRLVFPDAVLDTLTSLDAAVAFVDRSLHGADSIGVRQMVLGDARYGEAHVADRGVTHRGKAATPALALVAAALRALAARDGGGA